jgi:hypothetical protein
MDLKYLRNICLGKMFKNYSLEKVDILSPYLSDLFFIKLKELKPQHVCITTDAGCPSTAIKSVEEKLGNKINHIKLAQCDGIVHGKCYLFHWKNKKTNRYKRLFLWGSCNATEGGFERNAEVFSWLQLSKIDKDQRFNIISYFSDLRKNDDRIKGIKIQIDALTIKLPDIEFFKPESTTFDLWIQKGRLCHPFPNDPSFRHLRVVLKTKIAPDDMLSTELRNNNIGINQQTTIAYDYLRQNFDVIEGGLEEENDLQSDDNYTTTWKSRYFVDTVFGYWTSEDCFNDNGDSFHKRDTEQRENEIDQISGANSKQRDKWNENFLSILKAISDAIPNASEYFHYKDGELDTERYKKQFENQLNRDLIRSKDSWFRHGYISGYDFPEIPPMREFRSNWNELINSFSSSLFFEVNKSGTRSWLAQTVRDYTDLGTAVNSDDFLQLLRNKWKLNQEYIECFYCTEE